MSIFIKLSWLPNIELYFLIYFYFLFMFMCRHHRTSFKVKFLLSVYWWQVHLASGPSCSQAHINMRITAMHYWILPCGGYHFCVTLSPELLLLLWVRNVSPSEGCICRSHKLTNQVNHTLVLLKYLQKKKWP